MSCAEVAEAVEILFRIWTWVGQRNPVLDGDAYWCHRPCAVEVRSYVKLEKLYHYYYNLFTPSPLPSNRHHQSNGDCVEGKRENYQVCSVQYCVQQLCTVQCTHICTD